MGSSLPRHGARVRTKTQNRTQKKKKRTDYKLAQKKIYMMHEQINVMIHALMQ